MNTKATLKRAIKEIENGADPKSTLKGALASIQTSHVRPPKRAKSISPVAVLLGQCRGLHARADGVQDLPAAEADRLAAEIDQLAGLALPTACAVEIAAARQSIEMARAMGVYPKHTATRAVDEGHKLSLHHGVHR